MSLNNPRLKHLLYEKKIGKTQVGSRIADIVKALGG